MTAYDDASIDGDDACYRRVPPAQVNDDANRGRLWPSSASLVPSSGDTEVSVYLGSLMAAHGLEPEDLMEGHEQHGLMCFPVQAARDAGFGVKRDPVIDSDRPLKGDPAHAVLTGDPVGNKPSIRRARKLVYDDRVTVVRDPGQPARY